jgi:hypothetical protein
VEAGIAGGLSSDGSTGPPVDSGGVSPSDGGVVSPCSDPALCPSGTYCDTTTGQCVACSDLSTIRFGAPQRIDAVSLNQFGNQRFPRVTRNPTEMLFQMGDSNGPKKLWLIPNFNQNTGATVFGSPVDVPSESISGGIEVFTTVPGLQSANLFFDRTAGGAGTFRILFGGARTSGTTVAASGQLPSPFNTLDPLMGGTPSSNYSIAIASRALRAYWMSNRNGQPQLLGAPLVAGGALSSAAPVTIGLSANAGCVRTGADATPWVTPDGTVLFFRTLEVGTNCTPGPDSNDLWYVRMDAQGQPASAAVRIANLSTAGWDDTDPSLSGDLCWLYFSTDGGPPDYEYDVYRAPRQ